MRSAKNKHYTIDVRVTKANFFTNPQSGSLVNEASWWYKIAYDERVPLHAALVCGLEKQSTVRS